VDERGRERNKGEIGRREREEEGRERKKEEKGRRKKYATADSDGCI
jgi:hypothetical protein